MLREVAMRKTGALAVALLAPALWVGADAYAQDSDNRALALGLDTEPVKPWAILPYWEPVSFLKGEFVSGISWTGRPVFTVQLVGGIGGGVSYRRNSAPHWYGFSRGIGYTTYSITHGTLGLAGRVGSFFGIDTKWVRVTAGPDFWYDVYGLNGFGGDYHLPGSPGLDVRIDTRVKFTRDFGFEAVLQPGWAFDKDRVRTGALDLFEIGGYLHYFGEFDILVGWRAQWNSAGRQHGPVIGARFQ